MTDKEMEDPQKQAELHSAGAIERHVSPFENLKSHKNDSPLAPEFITEWVVPYYMTIGHYDKSWTPALQNIKPRITKEVCFGLLGDFNWRSRLEGSYFAGVKGYTDMIDNIGIHLLKSEVCCVGHIYALTLSFFNTPESTRFLDTYLSYYLAKPDLYFDQRYVMSAFLYLDRINGSQNAEKHVQSFLQLMRFWKRPEVIPTTDYFDEQISMLKDLFNF